MTINVDPERFNSLKLWCKDFKITNIDRVAAVFSINFVTTPFNYELIQFQSRNSKRYTKVFKT